MASLAAAGGLEGGLVGPVFQNPIPGKLAFLDFFENFFHLLLGFLGHDPRAAGVVAELGRVRHAVSHVVQAALIEQVDDQLQFVHALEVGHFRLIAGFDQRFEGGLDQSADAAAEDDLLAEQVGLGFFGEGGFDDAAPRAADSLGIGQRQLTRSLSPAPSPMAISEGTPPPLTYSLRTRCPGPLGATSAASTPSGGMT